MSNEDEKYPITEFEQRRLIIDLLMRVTSENHAFKLVLVGVLSQGNPDIAKQILADFQSRYETERSKLVEIIFANYGHIDPEDYLKQTP